MEAEGGQVALKPEKRSLKLARGEASSSSRGPLPPSPRSLIATGIVPTAPPQLGGMNTAKNKELTLDEAKTQLLGAAERSSQKGVRKDARGWVDQLTRLVSPTRPSRYILGTIRRRGR